MPQPLAVSRSAALTSLVLVIVAATAGAFAFTEHLKLERSPVYSPDITRFFSPVCGRGCPTRTATIGFRLRRPERIDVAIVDRHGGVVRTLATGLTHGRGRLLLHWDGNDDAGMRAPDGAYRPRVRLDRERRTILIPVTVNLDTKAPRVRLISVRPKVFSPDGDRRRDSITLLYSSTELGAPLLITGDRRLARGHNHQAGIAKMRWAGRTGATVLAPGVYQLALRIEDRAGNVSRPTRSVSVRLRFIEVTRITRRVRRGGTVRFTVDTDASTVRWSIQATPRSRPLVLGQTAGPGPVAVRLPSRIRAGRYVLVVTERGHSGLAGIVVTTRG
jgi:hypothetical protein